MTCIRQLQFSRWALQVEALRPLGLQLLKTVLARFGDAKDPLLPESLLLEQFQAQFVSALRQVQSSRSAGSWRSYLSHLCFHRHTP